MSSATRQGGADERYATTVEASRRGAHRARPNPLLGILPLVAVAVVVIAVMALAYLLFGRDPGSDSSTASGSSPSASAGQSAAGAQTAVSPQVSASAGTPADAASPSGVAPAPTTSTGSGAAAGAVDRTLKLNFYNGTDPQVPGLSRKAAAVFTAKKWKIGVIQPWTGAAVTETTVYYASAAQQATAQAVVDTLGVGQVKLSAAKAAKGITVVISNDYTP